MKFSLLLTALCLSASLLNAKVADQIDWKVKTSCAKVHSKDGHIHIDLPANCSATLEVSFTIPKDARLDSISFQYEVNSGSLNSVTPDLKKTIKGGDLPDPRILDVGKVHVHDIALTVPPLELKLGSNVSSSAVINDPVFDILQPGEKISYLFKLTFTSNGKTKILINIASIVPNTTPFTLPTTPEDYPKPKMTAKGVHLKSTAKLASDPQDSETKTPIKHVILILSENVSFDNMFGTYPIAQNTDGIPFFPLPGTEVPDNLLTIDPLTGGNYLTTNRNVGQTGVGKVNPQRLAYNQVLTNFESNGYTRLQLDVNNGLMNHFVLNQTTPAPIISFVSPHPPFDATYGRGANIVMDYWDGNTFTGMWNYAQYYSMSDHCFTTGYGESVVGGINWGSGNNSEIVPEFPHLKIDVNLLNIISDGFSANPQLPPIPPGTKFIEWGDLLATFNNVALYNWVFAKGDLSILEFLLFWFVDVPASVRATITFPGVSGVVEFAQQFTANNINPKHKNIGDRLNQKKITWGAFRGGWLPKQSKLDPNAIVLPYSEFFPPDVIAQLQAIMPEFNNLVILLHASVNPTPPQGAPFGVFTIFDIVGPQPDYGNIQPFDYFASTSNPHILPYSHLKNVGKTDQANHNYDIDDFYNALDIGVLPAVSYVRLPVYQSGHPKESDAVDHQIGVVNLVNRIMSSPFWEDTVIFLQWDECNGNYDHKPPLLVRSSAWNVNPAIDPKGQIARRGAKAGITKAQLRAGYAPRIPFIVISPWAKQNHISHTLTDQTSIIRFIEKNWCLCPLGNCSYDCIAGSLKDLFDFNPKRVLAPKVFLNPFTGQVEAIEPS